MRSGKIRHRDKSAGQMLIPLYALTLFLSAFLLFWVQPLFTKAVLPLLGGSPAFWNTAMMFFQIALLAGYGYAHLVTRVARSSRQCWIHEAVAASGFPFLPLGSRPASTHRPHHSPLLQLIPP